MTQFQTISYVFLCCFCLLESLILGRVLHKTSLLQKRYGHFSRAAEWHGLPLGTDSPKFSLPLLESGKRLGSSDLKGRLSVLFFVSPQDSNTSSHTSLAAAVHAVWHRTEGGVYLVCAGDSESCGFFRDQYLNGFPESKIICDVAGVLARGFQIDGMPEAVELDEDARVKRYGRPQAPELDAQDQGYDTASHEDKVQMSSTWPDSRPMSGAGFARVDTTIACVLSRFRLNSVFSIVPFYLAFRRIQNGASSVPGFMKAVLLFENHRTFYTLSFWKDDWSIVQFSDVRAHISAANSAFDATYREDLKRAEIWSAQFRLWAVSSHNLNWEGLDLQTALGDQWHKREKITLAMEAGKEEPVA
jgi:hypothetical protein